MNKKFVGIGSLQPYKNNCHFCDAKNVYCVLVDQCVCDASICVNCLRELVIYMEEQTAMHDHTGHGDPYFPDCICRSTSLQKECAMNGCGYCKVAEEELNRGSCPES